jgi:uncharacterized membrane protein YedE/YeeE
MQVDYAKIIQEYFNKVFMYRDRVFPQLSETLKTYETFNTRFAIRTLTINALKVSAVIFIFGVLVGGIIAGQFMSDGTAIQLGEKTVERLTSMGISNFNTLLPQEIFNWNEVFSFRTILMTVVGGFFIGFGARYGGGCTSGHAIMGLSNLQLASLIAVIGFFIGGLFITYFILPSILAL